MDFLYGKAPKSMTLIRALFGIICLFFLFAIVALLTLDLQRTVRATGGEIIAENGPVVYVAPAAARVEQVRVRSGDAVRTGDTLLVLESPELTNAYAQTRRELEQSAHAITVYEELLTNLNRRLTGQRARSAGVEADITLGDATDRAELRALTEQLDRARQRLGVTKSRLDKTYAGFVDGVISEADYAAAKRAYLAERSQLTELEKRHAQQRVRRTTASARTRTRRTDHELTVLAAERERLELRRQLADERTRHARLREQHRRDSTAVSQLHPVATLDGTVSKLFNLRAAADRVAPQTQLLTLLPQDSTTYRARLKMPQPGMRDVRTGQPVRVKVDAYHHFRYGVLDATVSHIDHDPVDGFYLLADISPAQRTAIELQHGFGVKGDVVTGRVPLWRFVGETIFE